MAVLNNADVLLNQIVDSVDSKSPANINYVKARMAIEAAGLSRKPKRELKMAVISYLQGVIRHPDPADTKHKAVNTVVFVDGSHARF